MAKSKVLIDIKEVYKKQVIPELLKKYNYENVNMVPKIIKIVINRGIGESINDSKAVRTTVEEFKTIFAQVPIVTKARKSIAGFKLRQGASIGCKVTLRGDQMYYFMSKLVNVVLPKIRDFRGVSKKAFDKDGNYTLGIKEQIIFPEISYDKVDKIRGFNVTFVTTAKTKEESYDLLKLLGMPFRK